MNFRDPQVREIVTENGFPFVDTSSSFVDTEVKDFSIFHPLDSHPNWKANRIFADKLYDFLVGEQLLAR